MTKRYFWRRAAAFIIDALICAFVLTVVVLLANSTTNSNLIPPIIVQYRQCDSTDIFAKEEMNEIFSSTGEAVYSQTICNICFNIFSVHHQVILKMKLVDNTNTFTIFYFSDDNGNKIPAYPTEIILYIALILSISFFTFSWKTTFGKNIMNVTVRRTDAKPLQLKQMLIREAVKFGPIIAWAAHAYYNQIIVNEMNIQAMGNELAEIFAEISLLFKAAIVLASLLIIWFYFGSFIIWRGRTYWDRFGGTLVEKLRAHKDND